MRKIALWLIAASVLPAQEVALRLARVVGGFTQPTAIAAVPDGSGRLLVLQQRGQIRIVQNGAVSPELFLDWSSRVSCCGERGLLGMAFPPGFTQKRYVYINYTDPQGASTIARVRLVPDALRVDPGSEQVLLRIPRTQANHNGGNIVFGPDGYLYIGTGDSGGAGDPENAAQNPNEFRGKMLRIDTESGGSPYAIPPSNPFVNRSGYRPEIWAVGLRNPWRYSFDRETRDLWIADVGQNRAEEINVQPASSAGGVNYGWPTMEGLECFRPQSGCNRDGLTLPVLEYGRGLGISVTGGFVYRGQRFPSLNGAYLYADYGSGRIWSVRRNGSSWQNQELLRSSVQISSFGEDESGELYLTDYSGGNLYAVVAGPPVTSAAGVVNAAGFGAGLVPGSLATVFGTGLTALNGVVEATGFPLPREMNGVSVSINGVNVPLLAVARVNGVEQINFQIPADLAAGSRATLIVNANGAASAPVEVTLAGAQPEIFAVTRTGNTLTVWATGLGATANAPAAGQPAPSQPLATLISEAQVTIGGVPAPVTYAGLAPGYAGLYQVNATVPAAAPIDGDVLLRIGTAVSKPGRVR